MAGGEREYRKWDGLMVWWHHWCNGPEFEQTPGDGEGQEILVCAVHGVTKNWTGLRDWITATTTTKKKWKINGEHRKAFVPRNPTGSCLVSMAGLHFLAFFEVRCYHVNSFGQWNVSGKTLHDESLDEHSQTVDSLTAALWDLEQWPNSVMPRLKETIILGCSFK